MSDFALRVHSLSKLYHIGARVDPHATLRDTITAAVQNPANSMTPIVETFRCAFPGAGTVNPAHLLSKGYEVHDLLVISRRF